MLREEWKKPWCSCQAHCLQSHVATDILWAMLLWYSAGKSFLIRKILLLLFNSTNFFLSSPWNLQSFSFPTKAALICSWPLWDEVIKRKFLFSAICFTARSCCLINFTRAGMCFKSALRCARKSSHTTDLSKHFLLSYGKAMALCAAFLQAFVRLAPGPGTARSPSWLQSQTHNNHKIKMPLPERSLSVLKSADVKGFEEGKGEGRAAESPACRQWLPHIPALCVRTGAKDWGSVWHFSEERTDSSALRALYHHTLAPVTAAAANGPPTHAGTEQCEPGCWAADQLQGNEPSGAGSLWRGACCLIKCSTLSRTAYLHSPAGRPLCWLVFLDGL